MEQSYWQLCSTAAVHTSQSCHRCAAIRRALCNRDSSQAMWFASPSDESDNGEIATRAAAQAFIECAFNQQLCLIQFEMVSSAGQRGEVAGL